MAQPSILFFMGAKPILNLLGDRLHSLPLVVLYLTDGCNSRCVTCDIWRNPRRNMSMQLVEQLAGEFRHLNVRHAILSGGEAMQHPQWPEIARRFRAEGTQVTLLTNGLLLKKQAQAVIDSVDEVVVSLDGGTAATYDAVRGVDGFDLILEGIRLVRAGGVPVSTRTTLQRANYQEMPQIIEATRDAGVNHISFLTVDVSNPYAFGPRFAESEPNLVGLNEIAGGTMPLIANMGPGAPVEHGPPAPALTSDDIARFERILDDVEVRFADLFAQGQMAESPAKLRRMADYFRAIIGEGSFPYVRCNAPHISTVIEVDGSLRPCYFLPKMGRLKPDGESLAQALNEPAALALRQAYKQGERPECERCVCPLYRGPRALWRM